MQLLRCVLYLLMITIVIFLIGRIYPRKWIKEKAFPFEAYKWEHNTKIYQKLKVKKWKTIYPDFSSIITKVFPNFMPKKRIDNNDKNKIPILIKETCVAEATHIVAIIMGFRCVKICESMALLGWILTILFTLVNIPPILIQRYNRPRLMALTAKI